MTTTMDCSPLHLVTRDFNYYILDRSQILYLKYIWSVPVIVDDSNVDEEQRGRMTVIPREHQMELMWKSPENATLTFRCKDWKTREDVDKYIASLFTTDVFKSSGATTSAELEARPPSPGRAGGLVARPPIKPPILGA
jgi:hypothetical protein